ncbi:Uncharacterized protein GmHk_19G053953 [Glycine max]|nr:Uncharacterized protein GmHk_19G053953 [Glycine max]
MGEKRITLYRSSDEILLVGEGDFSFSLCLARAFGTAKNMVATSLDSRASLRNKYGSALGNLTELEALGCTIVHRVDVHTMLHKDLVSGFLYNAKYMLNKGGEIHITHKTTHPFSKWNIKKLAKRQG